MKAFAWLFAALVVPVPFAWAGYLLTLHGYQDRAAGAVAGTLLYALLALLGRRAANRFFKNSGDARVTYQRAKQFLWLHFFHLFSAMVAGSAAYYGAHFRLHRPHRLSFGVAWVAAVLFFWLIDRLFCQEDAHKRGTKVLAVAEAELTARRELPAGDDGVFFGGLFVAQSVFRLGVLILGAIGSGKSLIFKTLMKQLLPAIGKSDTRAVVYDAKRDVLGYLDSLGLGDRVVTLNPMDARCAPWDIARDINDGESAEALAEILVPPDKEAKDKYFDDAARALLEGVVLALIRAKPLRWALRDVVYCLRSQERIKELLARTEEGRDLVQTYFSKPGTAADVMSTVWNKVKRYRFVAEAWHRSENKPVSLEDWLRGRFVLVLGKSHKAGPAVRAINEVIFLRLSQMILDEPEIDPETSDRAHYIFLDELRFAGKLPVNELIVEGRSKGAVVVMGVQDPNGIHETYGDKAAEEILGQPATIAVLRLQNPAAAEWASKLIGRYEAREPHESQTSGPSGSSNTAGEQVANREAVLPSELMRLPRTTRRNGLTGYFMTPDVGVWRTTIPGAEVARRTKRVKKAAVPDFVPWPPNALDVLEPWSADERVALGLPKEPPAEAPGKAPQKAPANTPAQPPANAPAGEPAGWPTDVPPYQWDGEAIPDEKRPANEDQAPAGAPAPLRGKLPPLKKDYDRRAKGT